MDSYVSKDITGDGVTTYWPLDTDVRYIEAVSPLPLTAYRQEPRGVTIEPPLAKGQTVTVWFYEG